MEKRGKQKTHFISELLRLGSPGPQLSRIHEVLGDLQSVF